MTISHNIAINGAAGYAASVSSGGGTSTPVADPSTSKYVSLLLNGDGTNGAQNRTFIDSSTNNATITRYGDATQGSFGPFGNSWSNYFDGTGDYLQVASPLLDVGTGSFTIELWFNSTLKTNYQSIVIGTSATLGAWLHTNSSGYVLYGLNAATYTAPIDVCNGAWHHIAFVRNGASACTLYIDGISASSATDGTNVSGTVGTYIGAYYGNSRYVNGYISNLRIVKGTALYTSNFTPSTTPLTAVAGTSLLTCQSNRFKDNSTNNAAITVYGNTSVVKDSPFPEVYDKTIQGASAYFDGTGDYLTIPSSTALNLSNSNFTIDVWIYPTSTAVGEIFNNSTSKGIAFHYDTGAKVSIGKYNVGYIASTAAGSVPLNTWSHIALVRNGNTFTLYVNGVSNVTGTDTITFADGSTLVGAAGASSFVFGGYISNLRVIKGTALYTTNFTPSTAPLTAVTNTSLLLKCDNAGIVDATGKNDLVTYGNAQVSTVQKKYGTGAMYFDGTGDYLTIPVTQYNNLDLSSGDFTIEFWANSPMVANKGWIANWSSSSSRQFFIGYCNSTPSANINFNWTYNGTAWSSINSASVPSANVWHHYAATRSGNTVNFFIDGASQGTATLTGNLYSPAGTSKICVGVNPEAGSSWDYTGYIDDLRITKGLARYTANFTPPTAPLTL